MVSENERFESLDLGSSPAISIPMEVIEVGLDRGTLLDQYASQFVREATLANPLMAERVDLTEREMQRYVTFLLYQRVLVVRGECKNFHRLKVLYIPAFIQYILSMIGDVVVREKGIKLVPVMEDPKIDFNWAVKVSEKVGAFENDLTIVTRAMPKDTHGDYDVMNCALIEGYVRSIDHVQHPVSTYVAAVLGSTLRREADFKVLYRIQYDDLSFIEAALGGRHEIYR